MKASYICLIILIVAAVIALAVMVTIAADIKVVDRSRNHNNPMSFRFSKNLGVISWNDKKEYTMVERFPYVAAITVNSSNTWSFVCFASVILTKWVLTAAHCKELGSLHRVLLYYEYSKNFTHTHPILFWKLHEQYNRRNRHIHDIAIAKLNMNYLGVKQLPYHWVSTKYSFVTDFSADDEKNRTLEASVWKTVATMENKLFLTNDFDIFYPKIVDPALCTEAFGVQLDQSRFCVDMSHYTDNCFVHDFGPIYIGDRLVGIISLNSKDCDTKLAVFTNVTYYSNWVLNATRAHFD